MRKGQVLKYARCCVAVWTVLFAVDCFADVKVCPPTRELSEIEKAMSRALEFEMIRNGDQAGYTLPTRGDN